MPPRNTRAPPITTAITQKAGGGGLCRDHRLRQAGRGACSGDAKAALHRQQHRQLVEIRANLSGASGERAGADAGRDRAVHGEGLSAARSRRPKRCWRSSPPVDVTKQRVAWTVIGNSNFDQGIFDKAEAAYRHAQALMPANDPERARDRRAARGLDLQAGRAEEQGRRQRGGSRRFPARCRHWRRRPRFAPTRTSTRQRCSSTHKQWDRAVTVLEGFRRNFPAEPAAARGHAQSGRRVFGIESPRARRPSSSSGSRNRPRRSPGRAARSDAASGRSVRQGRRTPASPAVMLEAFVKHFPQPFNPAMEARNKLSLIAVKAGDYRRLATTG